MAAPLLTVSEVAARLGWHPHTVRRWIWSRKMKALKFGDLVRIREGEVDRFARPANGNVALPKRRPSVKGRRALLAILPRLRKTVSAGDVERLNRHFSNAGIGERPFADRARARINRASR